MITMSISIVISQPFNLKPAKDGLRNFLTSASRNSKNEVVESDLERYIYVIGIYYPPTILLLILVTLYSAVLVVTFSESAQMIMNIIGSSFFSLVLFP